jgi:nucleoside-diphosphate-sugar epimerase
MGADISSYNAKTVVVTGGLGFIGSNLVHALAAASTAQIRVVDSLNPACGGNPDNLLEIARPVEVHTFDMRESSALANVVAGADVIFNLAGQVSHIDSMENPLQDMRANVEAHLSLLQCCRRVNPGVRVVYSSTRQLYGRPQQLPVTEEHRILPVDINGINKHAAESYHRIYYEVYGLPTCSLRLTNTYGPRQLIRHARQGFIGWFLHQGLVGGDIVVFGDGAQLRDLTYVDCVVDALLLAGAHPSAPGKVYNLGSGEPVSLRRLAELTVRLAGKGRYLIRPFPEDRRRIDIGNYYGDSSLIERELGWRPTVRLADGIARTLAFYEARRGLYLEQNGSCSSPISI